MELIVERICSDKLTESPIREGLGNIAYEQGVASFEILDYIAIMAFIVAYQYLFIKRDHHPVCCTLRG
jgi:hypothetical protein